jgi:hypothetical protein
MKQFSRDICLHILELSGNPSPTEIRDAYRLLVKVWHPDKHEHDPKVNRMAHSKIKEINEAYEWLIANPPIHNAGSVPNVERTYTQQASRNPPPPPVKTAEPPSIPKIDTGGYGLILVGGFFIFITVIGFPRYLSQGDTEIKGVLLYFTFFIAGVLSCLAGKKSIAGTRH